MSVYKCASGCNKNKILWEWSLKSFTLFFFYFAASSQPSFIQLLYLYICI